MSSSEIDDERFEQFLLEIETLRGRDPNAALKAVQDAPRELSSQPESRLLAADLAWELEGPAAARAKLERLIADVPDYADARHLLAAAYEDLGERAAQIEQNLEVLRLDEGLDPGLDPDDTAELESVIVDAAEQTLQGLPDPFRERLTSVPILVEPRPSEDLVREGLDPRALGLFEGQSDGERQNGEVATAPTRIVLYSANLLAEAIDEDQLRDEVEITVLHEIGHYFGLEEHDMERLGLD